MLPNGLILSSIGLTSDLYRFGLIRSRPTLDLCLNLVLGIKGAELRVRVVAYAFCRGENIPTCSILSFSLANLSSYDIPRVKGDDSRTFPSVPGMLKNRGRAAYEKARVL